MDYSKIPPPMNLPLLINDPRSRAREALATVMAGGLEVLEQIHTLSQYFKIKVWFDKPLYFHTIRHWVTVKDNGSIIVERPAKDGTTEIIYKNYITGITTDCHVFSCIRYQTGTLLYATSRKPFAGRQTAYFFPTESMIKWVPIPAKNWRY